jgi:hypothetical protein
MKEALLLFSKLFLGKFGILLLSLREYFKTKEKHRLTPCLLRTEP